jgi:hypothetical protein
VDCDDRVYSSAELAVSASVDDENRDDELAIDEFEYRGPEAEAYDLFAFAGVTSATTAVDVSVTLTTT